MSEWFDMEGDSNMPSKWLTPRFFWVLSVLCLIVPISVGSVAMLSDGTFREGIELEEATISRSKEAPQARPSMPGRTSTRRLCETVKNAS